MDVHIGRQPVFDRARRVVGYELLFRDRDVAHARIGAGSGSVATARVLLTSFLDIGLEELVGNGLAFVNLPRSYLVGDLPLPAPPAQLVLEVLEDVVADDEVLAGVRELRAQGYALALDDFLWDGPTARLVPEVDIVKLDVLEQGDELERSVRRCQEAGVAVLAEKIETAEQLALCRDLDVTYYQGYYLQRPEVLHGRSLSPSQASCLRLLSELDRDEPSTAAVARLVSADAALSFRMLRAANTAAVGAKRRITGLREALLMLGFSQLRKWALLLFVADLPVEAAPGVEAALLRAAMCEQLATWTRDADSASAFVVGLVSGLDVLLDQPMTEVLQTLPLAQPAREALLEGTGPLGEVLTCVLAYESGELVVPAASGLPESAPRQAFLRALRTVSAQSAALQPRAHARTHARRPSVRTRTAG